MDVTIKTASLPLPHNDGEKTNKSVIQNPIKVFYCYAREDKAMRDELDKHLGTLKRLGQITTWHDREILPGIQWKREIDTRLNTSDIVLLLVSSHFISSDYCYGIEMRQALERHAAGESHAVPIILRPVDWKETPIADLQVLPADGKPITRWRNRDEAFHSVTQGIRDVIEMLQKKREREQASSIVLQQPFEERMLISYTNIDPHITQQRDTLIEQVYTRLIQPDVTALALIGVAGVGKSTVADLACAYAEKQRYAGKGPFLAQPLWLRINPADTYSLWPNESLMHWGNHCQISSIFLPRIRHERFLVPSIQPKNRD